MLNLILGGCGTGKSTRLAERIGQDLAAGKNVLILVPEQFSFEEEKRLYKLLGASAFNQLQTCSFATLSRNILRLCGENLRAEQYANDHEKLVFLYQAIRTAAKRGDLQVLSRRSDSADFISAMLSLIVKLRKAGVTAERLHDASASLPDRLGEKTADIAVILLEYERILTEHGLFDSLTDLGEAALRADVQGYFKGMHVYIDEFDSFTGDQYSMLDVMLSQAESVTAAIRTDEPDAKLSLIFEGGNRTCRALLRRAREDYRIPVHIERCTEFLRSPHPDLRAVSSQILRPAAKRAEYCGHVHIVETADPTSEAEYICAAISEMLAENSTLRCRDIAVAVRSLADYSSVLERAMERYELPCHISAANPVQHTELMRYFLALLAVLADESWNTELILRCIKNPFSGFDAVSVSMLEHFCFTWGIDGEDWLQPFYDEETGNTERAEPFGGMALERTRSHFVQNVQTLKKNCEGKNVRSVCEVLYLHLCGREEQYAEHFASLDTIRRREFTTLWNMLMEIMDTIVSCCGEQFMDASALLEMFRMMISSSSFSVPPQTLDSIQIVEAQTARLSDPAVVFVTGMNENVFPGEIQLGGMFTRQELEELEKQDIVISRMFFELYSDERLLVHKLFSAPSEQLFLTCPCVNTAGELVRPSIVISQLRSMFPEAEQLIIHEKDIPVHFYIRTPAAAYFHFVRHLRSGDPAVPAIRQVLEEDPLYAERIRKLSETSVRPDHHVAPERMQQLLGRHLTFSPSGIEDFYKCPFWYFCRRCLKLYVPEQNSFSYANVGSFAHYCLEKILKKYDVQKFTALTQEELLAEIRSLSEVFSVQNFSEAVRRDGRFQLNYRMSGMGILQVLRHMQDEMKDGKFVPVGFEVEVNDTDENAAVPPLTLRNGEIRCVGKIDRVDHCQDGDAGYLRVVDYKTGNRAFEPEKLASGLDMQMLIYLFTLEQSGLYPDTVSGGVLYMPSGQPDQGHYSDREKNEAPADILNEYYRMKGLLLDTAAPLMEPEVQSSHTPVLNEESSALYSVDAEQMQKLRCHVEKKICDMADALKQGEIEPEPYLNLPCAYCGCSDLCGTERRPPEKLNKEERLAAIEAVFGTQEDAERTEKEENNE